MTAVQCRNRKNIHKRKSKTDKRSNHPELIPAPRVREHISDSTETTKTLCSLTGKYIFHLAHIRNQFVDTDFNTTWNRLPQIIFNRLSLIQIRNRCQHDANFSGFGNPYRS